MTNRVTVSPSVLQWAITRSKRDPQELVNSIPQLPGWLLSETSPTIPQLRKFASQVRIAFPLLLRDEPQEESLPIADFRRIAGENSSPSTELTDSLRICIARQDWYRSFLLSDGANPLNWVGSISVGDEVKQVARHISESIGFEISTRVKIPDWNTSLSFLIDLIERTGCLVMINGIVGNNTSRKLNVEEFRGFSLSDTIAPLIFVNGADSISARMFTLGHELAHVWLGEAGISNASISSTDLSPHEQWCNAVAAELLVPQEDVFHEFRSNQPLESEVHRLKRRYKVSPKVVLIRLLNLNLIERSQFNRIDEEFEQKKGESSGGNFYLSQKYRLSRDFVMAVAIGTEQGSLLYQDAHRLLAVKKSSTFNRIISELQNL